RVLSRAGLGACRAVWKKTSLSTMSSGTGPLSSAVAAIIGWADRQSVCQHRAVASARAIILIAIGRVLNRKIERRSLCAHSLACAPFVQALFCAAGGARCADVGRAPPSLVVACSQTLESVHE